MSQKRTKKPYKRSDNYWDFTRNMSIGEIEKSQKHLKKLKKNRKLHDKYWKNHEDTDDNGFVSNSDN